MTAKIWQRVASAALAMIMSVSTVGTTVAYAAEQSITIEDSAVAEPETLTLDDATAGTDASTPAEEPESNSSPSSTEQNNEVTETPVVTESPSPTSETTDTPEPTVPPSPAPETTDASVPSEEPDTIQTPAVSTSETADSGFSAIVFDGATEGQLEVSVGQEVTLSAHLSRDDVNVSYQWFKHSEAQTTAEYDKDNMVFDYGEDEPTSYGFLVSDQTPAEVLAENSDATWSGIELYLAVADALREIGQDPSKINIAFATRNYALEGFSIHAEMVDGKPLIYADSDTEHAVGKLNENNEFVFASTSDDHSVDTQSKDSSSMSLIDSMLAAGWEAIEGATSETYTHVVDEADAYTAYRCVVTINDADYIEAAKTALIANGANENALTSDTMNNTMMTEVTFSIPVLDYVDSNTGDAKLDALDTEDLIKVRLAAAGISTYASSVGLDSQSNPQWIVGLSAGMEYLTADMYAKIYGPEGWLTTGQITAEQADMYWTYIANSFGPLETNVLDENGFPTGQTRRYRSFVLTDGNKLEINSDWYGKTVYFRYYNKNVKGNTNQGTAVSIPAAGRGTTYKDAVQVLFCYTVEQDGTTLPLTIKQYVTNATKNGYTENGMAHITLNTVSCNDFNVDPEQYLKDAEGTYRVDSVYWGTCYYSEPDLSGKAYYALKSYIGNGYGFGVGHDTMYAYAGAWFDAHGGGRGYPNNVYDENDINPNDTATRYYSVNSWEVSGGHWNMNALMGENNSNTLVGSGYYNAEDEAYFGWIVDPLTVPSAIMSSGGSHGPFFKTTIYGSRSLHIKNNGGYTYEDALVNADIKHRTPTNWPYKFSVGQTVPAALTHSNGQVAFDDIWVDYNGCASDFTGAGLGKLYQPVVNGRQGTNNFYLAGSGNFIMNQIGHLPIVSSDGTSYNAASSEEMRLCVNTLMWISQRKQCEVCAADQHDQQATHFVHRVNSANAKKILTALQNGGSYWYPLDDCYELMEDLDLKALGFGSWDPIKNFTGHWNSKYFNVTVPNDGALFENTTGTRGEYSTGDANSWNLGTDRTCGVVNVFKLDTGSSLVRTTGIARVYGKLSDAKLFNDGQNHEGYTVHIRYEDNQDLLQQGDDFSCVVNNVDQYLISNLPCIYTGASTIMRARVYDRNGNEVTQYGPIIARVPPHFWNDCETIPLELLQIEATPIENYQYWEGATSKVLTGSGLIYNQPIDASQATWYYRVVDNSTGAPIGNWIEIGKPGVSFTTEDGAVTGVIGMPVFHTGENGDGTIPHTSIDVQLSMLAYTGNGIQLRTDYVVEGKTYSTIDAGVILQDSEGIIRIEERPMYMTQSPDVRVMTQDAATLVFESDYWKGVDDSGYSYKIQYATPSDPNTWIDLATSSAFSGTYTLNTVDGSQVIRYTLDAKTVDTIEEGLENQMHDGRWVPGSFWRPTGFTDQQCAQKHTTVTLHLNAAEFAWNNYSFRLVASYRFNAKRTKTETTTSANGDNNNSGYDTSRYGKLIIDTPTVQATPLYGQALMLQKHNDENDGSGNFGQNYWTEKADKATVDGWNSSRGPDHGVDPLISDDNTAEYTTKITFSPGVLTESGSRLLTPVINWGYQYDLTSNSRKYTSVTNPININGYANKYENGVGLTTENYKDFANIIQTRYDITKDSNLGQLVDQLEKEHAGSPFREIANSGYLNAYITIDDIHPEDPNADVNNPYTKWVIVTTLHIDCATNPMDFGNTHFYFQCEPILEYIRGYNDPLLQSQTSTQTKGYNFDYDNGGYRTTTDTGAELYLDYNISVHANDYLQVGCSLDNSYTMYRYPELTIEAPNGLRYILTRYRVINEFPYGNPRQTSRTTVDNRDSVSIDMNMPYMGSMNMEITVSHTNGSTTTINPYGKSMKDLGISLDTRGTLSTSSEEFTPYLKNGVGLYSDYNYPKEIWQWFWRNAVTYNCYDPEAYDQTNEQVYFYIDEKNIRSADMKFGANNANNPYSSWTAPFDATYEIVLNGAGGGNKSDAFGGSSGGAGGKTKITANIKEGTTLYFVAGGAGTSGNSPGGGHTPHATEGVGGYNGGGNGWVGAIIMDSAGDGTSAHTNGHGAGGGGGGASTVATSIGSANGLLSGYGGYSSTIASVFGVAGGGAGGGDMSGNDAGGQSSKLSSSIGVGQSGSNLEGNKIPCATEVGHCAWNDATGTAVGNGAVSETSGGGGGGLYGGISELHTVSGVATGTGTKTSDGQSGGSSYAAGQGASLLGGNIVIVSTQMVTGGGAGAGRNGSASIRVVDLDQRLLRRVGKNAMDIDFQMNECGYGIKNATVLLSVANKIYDGAPLHVTATFVANESDAGVNGNDVLAGVSISYSNNTSSNIPNPTNATTDGNRNPLAATNSYTATASYSGNYNVTFKWENTAPGKTYLAKQLIGAADTPVSGTGNVVYFDIYPRPLDLYSANNDRIYNNISTAKIENITIAAATADSGIVNGDPVALNSTLAYGYYCDPYDGTLYAQDYGEQLHTGLHSIKALTTIILVNDPNHNYYIRSENFTGTINPRPLYVHSLYHDTEKYTWTYDGNSNDIGRGRNLTDTVSYNGQGMTVAACYEAILAGSKVTSDITRYTKTEQDNYTNDVVAPNNIKMYDSYYNATIGENGKNNIYIDNITNNDIVDLNAATYVGSYADSNAGETLTGFDSNGDNGVPQSDRYNGLTEDKIEHLPYKVKYSYSTDTPKVGETMTVTIAVTNTDQGYGLAAQGNYVAPQAIKNLMIKSRFAGNGPITLVSTNGVRTNQDGTEFFIDSIPVGETFNIVFNYTVQQDDDPNALVRNIEQSNEMYLINNNYDDYYIADKDLSGGIYRNTIRVQIKSTSVVYGTGFGRNNLPFSDDVYYWNKGSDSWMTMEGLVEDHKTNDGNDEYLDLKDKNSNDYKSEFVYPIIPNESTDVGSYPVSYIGLNEFNYDVLKNYIVTEDPGSIEVTPRKIMVSVEESQKIYGTANPYFHATFRVLGTDSSGNELDQSDPSSWTVLGSDSTTDYNDMRLVAGDTIGSVIQVSNGASKTPLAITNGISNLPYLTTADTNSDVIYQTDVDVTECEFCNEQYNKMFEGHNHYHDGKDHPHSHAAVNGYPVSVNDNPGYGSTLSVKTETNEEGKIVSNYELVYESSVLKIHPRLIYIEALDGTKAYGGTEPALSYTIDGQIIKPTSEMLGIRAVRETGENVRDNGYNIHITYEESTANNYIVETRDATFTITPVPLIVNIGNQERYYGEENTNDYTINVIGLRHGDTADTALVNNGLATTGNVLTDAKNALNDWINLNYTRLKDVGSNYLYGDQTYLADHGILVPRQNSDGGYNYYVATYQPGVLQINPRPMRIDVTGWQKELGEADKVQEFTLTDKLTSTTISGTQELGKGSRITDPTVVVDPKNAPIVFNLVRAEGEKVGSYPVYSTEQERQTQNLVPNNQAQLELDNPNYDFEYYYANDLIVKRQGLIIVVDDKTRYYGDRVNRFYDGSTEYTYHVYEAKNGEMVEVTPEEAGINTDTITFGHLDTQTSSSGTYKDSITIAGVTSTLYDESEITILNGTLTIIPRPVTVVVDDKTKVYGDSDPTLTYTLHDGVRGEDGNFYMEYLTGPVLTDKEGAAVPVQPGDLEGGNVYRQKGEEVWTGKYTNGKAYAIDSTDISPYSKDGVQNYDITVEEGNFTITPAELTVTVMGGYSKTYGEDNPDFSAEVAGFKREDKQEDVLSGKIGFATLCYNMSGAGKYIITAGSDNEDTVNPDCMMLEDGKTHSASTLTVKPNSNNEKNYVIRYINGDITVNPKAIVIRIDHKTKTYGAADPAFTFHYEDNAGQVIGLVDPENSSLNVELYRTAGENVIRGDVTASMSMEKWGTPLYDGDYLISARYDTTNPNYTVTVYDGSLKIVPATITVKVDGGYRTTYGDDIPEFTYSMTGFVGRDVEDQTGTGIMDDESVVSGTATLYCNDTLGNPVSNLTKVGTYPINYSKTALVSEHSNYKFVYIGGDLTIGKKPIHIKADDQTKIYGETDPDPLTWTITDPDEIVNPGDEDFFIVNVKRPGANTDEGEHVGQYPITIDGEDPTGNYEIITTPGTLTIKPATIVVTVLDDEKYFGEDNPVPKVTITGYKRGDTIDDIGGQNALVVKTDAGKWSPVGDYNVTAKDSTFQNPDYEFVYVDGNLKILPLIINIKADDNRKVYGDNDPEKFTVSYEFVNEANEPYKASEELKEYVDRTMHLDATRIPGENVRTTSPAYPIIPTYDSVPNIEVGTVTPGQFYIDPRPVVITANSASKIYDGTPLTDSGYTYTPELVNNETLGIHDVMDSVTVTGSQTEVGNSPNVPSNAVITNTVTGTGSNSNYSIEYVNGTLTVYNQEKVTIEKSANREHTTDYDVIRYTVTVMNSTSHDLHNVVVKDTNNFYGTPVLSQSGNVTFDGENSQFIIAELPHDRTDDHTNSVTFSYTYTVQPEDHGTNGNDILVNNAQITDMDVVLGYTEGPNGTQVPEYGDPEEDWLVKTPDVDVDIIRQNLTIEKSANKAGATVGDVVTYTLKVTNTGNVTLKNVVISDDNNFKGNPVENTLLHFGYTVNADGTWTIPALGVGNSVTITYRYTVTEDDLANKQLENTATAIIPPRDDPKIPEKPVESNEVIVPLTNKHLTIVKQADREYAYPGEVVTYKLIVTNDGTINMKNVTITDNSNAVGMFIMSSGTGYTYNPDAKAFIIPSLAVGESVTIEYPYVVNNGDPDVIHNVATATAPKDPDTDIPGDKDITEDSNPEDVIVLRDKLAIKKDADRSFIELNDGETDASITYTLTVSNNGNTDLHTIVVTDTTNGNGTIEYNGDYDYNGAGQWVIPSLGAGESVKISYVYHVVPEDASLVDGNIINTAVAEGKNPNNDPVPSTPDDETVHVGETPMRDVTVIKTAAESSVSVGDTIHYTIHVTNNGKLPVTNVVVADYNDGVGDIVARAGDGYVYDSQSKTFTIAEIPAGETTNIPVEYTVQEGDGDVVNNTAVERPEIPVIVKQADKTIAHVDEQVTYTITVTNTTKDVLANVIVKDTNNFVGTITPTENTDNVSYVGDRQWLISSINPDESVNIVYTYTVSTGDQNNGTLVNQADMTYTTNEGKIVLESNEVLIPVPPEPTPEHHGPIIVKQADKAVAQIGDTIHYTVTLVNNDTVDYINTYLTDANNFSGVITNVVGGELKYAEPGSAKINVGTIPAGHSVTVEYDYVVASIDAGENATSYNELKNTATLHYWFADEEPTPDNEKNIPSNEVTVKVPGSEVPTPVDPPKGELKITKSVDKAEAAVGDILHYTVTVANIGDGVLKNVRVEDFFDGHGSLNFIPSIGITVNGDGTYTIKQLPAHTSIDLHFTYQVVAEDAPEVLNAVVGTPEPDRPPLEPEKSADKSVAYINDVVTYTISVYNPDTEAKNNVTVKDTNNFTGKIVPTESDKYNYVGDNVWNIPTIAAGETINITYTYTVRDEDPTMLENEAVVTYTEDGTSVELPTNPVDIPVPEIGQMAIHKMADKTIAKPGEVVTYKVTITNNKGFDVHDVVVSDHNNFVGQIAAIDGSDYTFENGTFHIATIPNGGSVVLTYTYTVQIGDVPTQILDNYAVATVPGTTPEDPDSELPSNHVEVEVPGDEVETEIPDISISKSVDKAEAKIGETLNYTVTVSNSGKADAQNVLVAEYFGGKGTLTFVPMDGVTDNGDGTYTIASVRAGSKVELHFTYVVVDGDAPNVLNAAVITEPDPPVVVEKEADKHIAKVDEVVSYTIRVTNTTDSTVTDLLVSDNNNFAGDIVAQSADKYTYNGNRTWTIASMEPGEVVEIEYTYTMQAEDESTIVNQATIEYSHDGEDYKIPSEPVEVEKPNDGTITIHKDADKSIAKPGEVVTYTVTIHNGKDHDVENVRLTDANNFAGVIEGVDGAGYTFKDGEFLIDRIPAGASVMVHYTYTVMIPDVDTQILKNVATAHVPSNDPDKPNEEYPSNEVEVKVPGDETETPVPEGKIELTKSVDKTKAEIGDTLHYTVTASNVGGQAVDNVIVKDFFGGKGTLTFIPMDGVTDNGDGSYTIAAVNAGESVSLHFTYIVVQGDAPKVLNAAVVEDPNPPVVVEKEANKHIATVDEIVTYTIRVTNTTDETVKNLLVSDTNNFTGTISANDGNKYVYNGDRTWTIASMNPGEVVEITYTYTMQAEDASVIENEATVKYSHDGKNYEITSDPVKVEKPDDGTITIHKDADKSIAEPSEIVTYTVTIHNGKDYDVENVRLTDANNFAGVIEGVDGAGYTFENGEFLIDRIPAGESVVVHYTYTVTISDVDTHILKNVATAHVPSNDPDKPEEEYPSNEVEVKVPGDEVETEIPTLTLTKTVDKQSAHVGDILTYTVNVANTGDVDAQNVLVAEYFGGKGTLAFVPMDGVTDNSDGTYTVATVPANSSVSLSFTYVVAEDDAPEVLNAAVITEPDPPVVVEKEADKHIAKVDEVVSYTIRVTNTTDSTVTDLLVSDNNNFAGDIVAQSADKYTYNGNRTWTIASMEPGEVVEIEYTYTMQAEDESTIVNQATVEYSHDGEDYKIPSEPVEVEKPNDGTITIHKDADKSVAKPGEIVTYTVTIHNGKDYDVENVRLTDANNFAGVIEGVDGAGYTFENGEFLIDRIPAGASVVVHYTYTVTISDVDTQILKNVATAHVPSNDPDKPDEEYPSNEVEVKVPGDEVETELPKFDVTKSVDKTKASVGDTLNYTVTVTNRSNMDAKSVILEDYFDGVGNLAFIPMDGVTDNRDGTYTIANIPAAGSVSLSFTYVVQSGDAPVVLNAAIVDEPDTPVEIEKDADKYIARIDEVVTYTIRVENTTDSRVTDLTVSDHNNFTGALTAESTDRYTYNGNGSWTIGYMDPGEVLEITYTYTVTTADPTVMENTAKVTYTHDGERYQIPSNPVDVEKPDDGVITIRKTADKTVAKPGEVITYTVTVHNGKDYDIENATLTDANNFSGDIFAVEGSGYHYENGVFTIDKIPAGGDIVIRYAYTATIADVDTQILENTATIHVPGRTPDEPTEDIPSNPVDVEVPGDEVETEIPTEKNFTIVKSADKSKVHVGETIQYRLVITNTGNVDLINVAVKDTNDGAGAIVATSGNGYTYDASTTTFTIAKIPVGESFTLLYSYVAQEADAGHDVTNVAVAKAPGQNPKDPTNPGHGIDPDKPIDEDVEKPSNEVIVPVVKDSTPVTPTPDQPTPTPTPTPIPTPTPTPTPMGWLEILTVDGMPLNVFSSVFSGNWKTGIGFAQGMIGLIVVLFAGIIAFVIVVKKRNSSKPKNEDAEKDTDDKSDK